MAASIQKFREIVFQLLYSHAFKESDPEAIVPLLMKQHAISRKSALAMTEKASKICESIDQLDRAIERFSQGFPLEKIGMVERALLRQGVYELLKKETPPKVVISEAIRLSKKFSTPESGAFVNALLDAIYKGRDGAALPNEPATA